MELAINMFPEATSEEIKETKSLLTRYRRMQGIVQEYERFGTNNLAPEQKSVYNSYLIATESIDRAVKLIPDDEIRRIVEMRYIKGVRHKNTVLYFSNMSPSTVDRKIKEGIGSIANTLKLLK